MNTYRLGLYIKHGLRFAAAVLALLLVWLLLFWFNVLPVDVLPSPYSVMQAVFAGWLSGEYILAGLVSLRRLAIGFSIALTIAAILGTSSARFTWFKQSFGTLVLGFQTLPSITWLPIALLWFGLNDGAIIFVVIMGSVFSLSLAIENTIRTIPPVLLRAGKMLEATGWKFYRYVILPAMLPNMISGLKQGWAFAWRSLIGAEMLYLSAGLGQQLIEGREAQDIPQVMAVMVSIVIIGIFIDVGLLGQLERRVYRKWGLQR